MKRRYFSQRILPNVSKFFERPLFEQTTFRRGINPQHCFIEILEKWRLSKDKGESFGALLTYLPKTFVWLSHDFLIAKLAAYGFSQSALK